MPADLFHADDLHLVVVERHDQAPGLVEAQGVLALPVALERVEAQALMLVQVDAARDSVERIDALDVLLGNTRSPHAPADGHVLVGVEKLLGGEDNVHAGLAPLR